MQHKTTWCPHHRLFVVTHFEYVYLDRVEQVDDIVHRIYVSHSFWHKCTRRCWCIWCSFFSFFSPSPWRISCQPYHWGAQFGANLFRNSVVDYVFHHSSLRIHIHSKFPQINRWASTRRKTMATSTIDSNQTKFSKYLCLNLLFT